MAMAYQYLPAVPLWRVLAVGIPLAVAGLVLSYLMFSQRRGPALLWQAVKGLAHLVPPVAINALAITLLTSFTSLSTLQSVVVCALVLYAAALIATGCGALRSALGGVRRGLGRWATRWC